jgi:uncharacterized SAM-binding protein YcdF (DUF218 family)
VSAKCSSQPEPQAAATSVVVVRTAIVVPGNRERLRGTDHRISTTCLVLVREAEQLAASGPVDVVVFSGGSRGTGPSEAEQMRAAWAGPDVELVVEPTASLTAENAARTLPLLLERGIQRAVVVSAPLHSYRVRFFFSRLYGPRGIETQVHVAPVPSGGRAFAWELAAAALCRRQLRAAETELAREGVP